MALKVGYITRLIAILILSILQTELIQCQRPMLNSSTPTSSLGIGSPAPFMPTARPRSDMAHMVYKPSPPDSTGVYNSRAGKFSELKNQMRRNTTHFTHKNNFHDSTYMRPNSKLIGSLDRLKTTISRPNKTLVANTMGDTPDSQLSWKSLNPLRDLQNNFRQTVSQIESIWVTF